MRIIRDPEALIGLEEAHALWQSRAALFVDTRPRADFNVAHVPGARSVPLEVVARRLDNLPEDRPIVTYCT